MISSYFAWVTFGDHMVHVRQVPSAQICIRVLHIQECLNSHILVRETALPVDLIGGLQVRCYRVWCSSGSF